MKNCSFNKNSNLRLLKLLKVMIMENLGCHKYFLKLYHLGGSKV